MKRVFLQFTFRQGWFCEFLEEDRKTPLPRTVILSDEGKLFELVKRGGFALNIPGRQELDSDQEETRRRLAGAYAGPMRKATPKRALTCIDFLAEHSEVKLKRLWLAYFDFAENARGLMRTFHSPRMAAEGT